MADMTTTIAPGAVNHAIMQHYPSLAQMGATALARLQHALPAAHVSAVHVDIKLLDNNNAYKGVAGVVFKVTSTVAVGAPEVKQGLA
jgi:hypothetical protein